MIVEENNYGFLTEEEIKDIIKSHLKIESNMRSIDTIFGNIRMRDRIKYDPYYQRNYVWDKDKATYFIESILLGTEIPPLVFFKGDTNIEVIDGRQRYETIKNYIDNNFALSKKGLTLLKGFQKNHFKDLPQNVKDLFLDTKIRFIEFSIVNEPKLDDRKEDLIKKEIFRRYNSGITPLKGVEIDRAKYIEDDLNQYIKNELLSNPEILKLIVELLFPEKELQKFDNQDTLEKVLKKLRLLFVLHNIPISYYNATSGKTDLVDRFFQTMSNETDNVEEFYNKFKNKIQILSVVLEKFKYSNSNYNYLVFECLYWALSVMEKERINISKFNNINLIEEFVKEVSGNIELYKIEESHFYKNVIQRYAHISKLFNNFFGLDFDIYLSSSDSFKTEIKELKNIDNNLNPLTEFEHLRLNKPDPSTKTIEDICRDMGKSRFLLRPTYQRNEAISRIKSSALIESILLDIKIPPIFVFKRSDGVSEVVDGQQRILSILGYIGQPFMNEKGEHIYSEKNNFPLTKLKILTDIEKKKFSDLSEPMKNKIYDFNLSIVEIDAKLNPHFNPVDLFIRLNNKPFPIKEHSFEMWNSYVDREIITTIKENTAKHSEWFYHRMPSRDFRMQNQEMYTTLAFLEYYNKTMKDSTKGNPSDQFLIFQKSDGLSARIKDKSTLNQLMNEATTNNEVKTKFIQSIKQVEKFIIKTRTILINEEYDETNVFLKKSLDGIISASGVSKRTLQNIYLLWYILSPIPQDMINKNRTDIKNKINLLYETFRTNPNKLENRDVYSEFKRELNSFWELYCPEKRVIQLSEEEKKALIKKQSNKCCICSKDIYYGDELHVDHIKPIVQGGRDKYLNLGISHKICNLKKGSDC